MKTIVKIAGIGVPLILSGAVQATTVPPASSPQSTSTAVGSFILSSFNFGLSANVGLAYTESTTNIVIQTGNKKGKTPFGVNSSGGSVAACTSLAADTANGYATAAPSVTGDGCS